MIINEFQKTNLAFRGLSDEEPEEKTEEGIPEDDGDLGPDKFDEGLGDEGEGNEKSLE